MSAPEHLNPADKSWWPGDARLYSFEEIPLGRDVFIIGADDLENLRREWSRYLAEPDGTTPAHPNGFLNWRWGALEARGTLSCDVNVCITMSTRFHGAIQKLPSAKIVACVRFVDYEKRPYLVVSQDWFEDIERTMFSLYALVDVIGMKALLDRQGRVEREQALALRDGIDALAARNPDHAFLSFADNVLIKTNWSAQQERYDTTYRPEEFLRLVSKVREVFRSALQLDAYGVVTQGSNQLVDDALLRVSGEHNHVFLGSLGTPFADLFDIDAAVRAAIRAKTHPACEL
jgi:hypothetical protein